MARSFIRDFSGVGISKAVIILCGLTTNIIIARSLGPEMNGIIATLLVYPSIFMSIGSLGIRQSVTFLLGKNRFTEEQLKSSINHIWIFSSLFSVVVCFLLIKYLSNISVDPILIILVILPIPFSLFNTYSSGIFLGNNNIKIFNKIDWIPSGITLLLTLLLVLLFSNGIKGYFIAIIGGPLIIFLILLFKNNFIETFRWNINWKVIKPLLSLGLIYAISLLVINLNYKIDIILLNQLSTEFETGIYSKGSSIIQYLWQIPMLLSTIVIARSAGAKNELLFSLKITQLLRLSFIAILVGSLILFIFSEIIILGMFGKDFQNSVSVLNILLPGVLLFTIFKVMNMDLAGKGKPWVSLKAMTPALVINIILNIKWIPEYGADGASFASTVSYSIAALLFLHFYSKETGISIKQILFYKKSDFIPILQIIKKLKN